MLRSLVVGVVGLLVAASCTARDEVTPMAESTTTSLTTVATTESPTTTSLTMPPTTTTIQVTTTTTPVTTTTTLAPIEDVESGLFCRNLASMGYAYRDAVTYWQRGGAPLRMDADRNGIACETVYDEEDVLAFFGGSLPGSVTFNAEEWVGRTVELEHLGNDWYLRVEHDGSTLELPYVHGPLGAPLDAYPEASGWFVAEEPVEWWAPTKSADLMFWVVDSWEGRGIILAALGLRLSPERPLDYCFQDDEHEANDIAWWVGSTHTWMIGEPPTYFQRIDRSSFECSAG